MDFPWGRARKAAEEQLFDAAAEHYALWKRYAERNPDWATANPIQILVEKQGEELKVQLLPVLPEKETAEQVTV